MFADSVAEFTERPLQSVSCSDTGTEPYIVKENPRGKGGDEACMTTGRYPSYRRGGRFLAERTAQEFQRNSSVSGTANFSPARRPL